MASPKITAHAPVELDWITGSQFEAGRPGGPRIRIDAEGETAPSPFDVLLAAIAACSATDVVSILSKQRTPPRMLRVVT